MIVPRCDKCGEELMAYGAIILSPPIIKDEIQNVEKYHICKTCYNDLMHWIFNEK